MRKFAMIRVDANDHDFHLALIANCGSSWLVQFCEVLMDHAQRYVFISASAAYPRRGGQDEHKRIADAATEMPRKPNNCSSRTICGPSNTSNPKGPADLWTTSRRDYRSARFSKASSQSAKI
ncbi:FCD domain-containing protein [Shinella sp.]|uniref:FCD domain-containing protein n=1 Tax=Shinella sp. TaxID=1870904 RepID=UPI0039B864DD